MAHPARGKLRLAACLFLLTVPALAQPRPGAKPATPPAKPAAAETPATTENAEQLFTKLDYDRANDVAERVLKQKGLSHDQLVRTTRVLAITYAILDKEEQARDAFLQLLVFDPDYQVDPALGPKVSTPFMEARGQLRSLPSKPGLEVVPNVRSDGGQLRVTTRDPTHLAKKVVVGWRWTSAGDFTTSNVGTGEAVVEIAAAPAGRSRLDFYAQGLDERDNAVFEWGSAAVPKSAFAEAAKSTTIGGGDTTRAGKEKHGVLASPIFWLVAGAVVIGGGVTAGILATHKDPATEATLSPSIRCGTDLCK